MFIMTQAPPSSRPDLDKRDALDIRTREYLVHVQVRAKLGQSTKNYRLENPVSG